MVSGCGVSEPCGEYGELANKNQSNPVCTRLAERAAPPPRTRAPFAGMPRPRRSGDQMAVRVGTGTGVNDFAPVTTRSLHIGLQREIRGALLAFERPSRNRDRLTVAYGRHRSSYLTPETLNTSDAPRTIKPLSERASKKRPRPRERRQAKNYRGKLINAWRAWPIRFMNAGVAMCTRVS
jgi:hypothetical protein